MADVFCSSCQYGDDLCDTLFCDPNRLIVNITMTIMRTFCAALETKNTECFREFCTPWKRSIGEHLTDCTTFRPTSKYTDVEGMSDWCQSSCSTGNCPATHCQCAESVISVIHNKTTTPYIIVSQTQRDDKDKESLDVVSDLVCEQALLYQHNELERRYCDKQETAVPHGYDQGLLDQVQAFAPQILCALTRGSSESKTCSNMFCGDQPTASGIIRSSMCSVCEHFNDILEPDCANAYCK